MKIGIVEALFKVYNSFLSTKIDDYNSSMYYENPAYLLECYLERELFKKNVKILNTVYNRHFKSFQKIEKRYPDSQSELLKLPDPVKA